MKIKFLKDSKTCKKGEIIECKDDEAKVIIEEGYAVEYVDKKKLKKTLKILKDNQEALGRNAIIQDNEVHLVSKEEKEKFELISLLKKKNIFSEITEKELDKKIVREMLTRKAIFLCACGRLVKNCQIASYNLLVNDEAGIGKDYVTEKTLEILPKAHWIKRTRISPTVFTYWHNPVFEPEWSWDGKVFYNEDISEAVLNHEVFKVMCSSGSNATIVIKQRVYDIPIEGKPVMIITTASSIPSPELIRRFEFLNLDESIDQTKEIKKRHAEYAALGIKPEYNEKYSKAMELLERVEVKIPYAKKLPQYFPDESVMMRTKFPRFLDLIKASTAFHQFQRKRDDSGFLVANGQDYEIAQEIMVKLSSNKYMISLTKNQRKLIDFFENNPNFCENISKINEKMHNFISLPALKTNLGILTKYGLLEMILEQDSLNRDIEKYKLSDNIKGKLTNIKLPNFNELDSKVSKVSKDSKDSKDSKANLQK